MKAGKTATSMLALGALGVVFGDIGTSPLYAMQAIFGPIGHNLAITEANIIGVTSLMLWAITLVVAAKYIGIIMRADNQGEGGIMALIGLLKSGHLKGRTAWLFTGVGLLGVSLFYGDSAITPAISVLSAIEGLKVITPGLSDAILPITLTVLGLLFWIQRYGTGSIGKLFGPIMFVWFITLALGGVWQIMQYPEIIAALSPASAISFVLTSPKVAFVIMGAIVLAVTGAEALYADMGHFGRPAIARAWFWVVFPALIIGYMGQGALVLHDTSAIRSPFYLLYPSALYIPVLAIATAATLIASQSVISGAFSLTRQAVQLGYLPRLFVKHTSTHEIGQVYVPVVNMALLIAVALLIMIFGSSAHLASAYGVAVSGTLLADTLLFMVVMLRVWHKPIWFTCLLMGGFLALDIVFVASNAPKVLHGGLFPVLLALAMFSVLTTWWRGQQITRAERRAQEGPLQDFITELRMQKNTIARVPGTAIYIGHHTGFTPLALKTAIEKLHELHERVVIVTAQVTHAAHVPEEERAKFNDLGYEDGISQVELSYGYHDSINIPRTLGDLRGISKELDFDPEEATYFVSLSRASLTRRHNLALWRKSLYALLSRNALSTSDYFHLPVDRTVEIRSLLKL